jgi:lipopolysaccharide biosynthesis glycosyltransferase
VLQLITIVTPGFWPGFAALLQSVADNGVLGNRTGVRWLVICEQSSAPSKWLQQRHEAIQLYPLEDLPKVPILSAQNQGLRMEHALQKLGIFALPSDLGRCVYLDSDMICLGDLSGLVELPSLSAAYDHLQLTGEPSPLPIGDHVEFNTGVLAFAPDRAIFEELCAVYREKHSERFHKGDQDVFYFWAQGRRVNPLGSEWNFSKRHQDRVGSTWIKERLSQIKFLHFVGAKPWTSNSEINTIRECCYRWMEEIWWDYFEKSGFAAHMENPPRRSTALIRQWVLPWSKPSIIKEHAVRARRLLKKMLHV